MKKHYLETTFGKLKDGDCFWPYEQDCGEMEIQRRKIKSISGAWLVGYADCGSPCNPLRTPDDDEPVWIIEPSIWKQYPMILLVLELAVLTIGGVWWIISDMMKNGWWK